MGTEEVTFPVGLPAPVIVRLGVMTFTVTGAAAIIQTVAKPLFTLLCRGTDRSAVTGKGKMCQINQLAFYRFTKELPVIELKDEGKWVIRL